jgi:hypothetical protein
VQHSCDVAWQCLCWQVCPEPRGFVKVYSNIVKSVPLTSGCSLLRRDTQPEHTILLPLQHEAVLLASTAVARQPQDMVEEYYHIARADLDAAERTGRFKDVDLETAEDQHLIEQKVCILSADTETSCQPANWYDCGCVRRLRADGTCLRQPSHYQLACISGVATALGTASGWPSSCGQAHTTASSETVWLNQQY